MFSTFTFVHHYHERDAHLPNSMSIYLSLEIVFIVVPMRLPGENI